MIIHGMPAPIDEIVKRRVIQQWLAGEAREKITADNDIGAGTVSIIVDEYKTGLDNFDLDSFRELTLEAKKRGLASSDLASFFRLYNFFRRSGAKENEIESFIININSGYIPPGKAIELVNQLHDISKSEPIPLDQIPSYIQGKLEERQKIDEQIKEADATLQSKDINIEAINEHLQLNQKLKEHGLSFQDIEKLLNVLINAKENGFDPKLIVRKLRSIRRLEKKQERLKNSCEILSKKEAEYKELIPLAQKIVAMNIDINELLVFDNAVQEISKQYSLPSSVAAFRLFDEIKDYNKIGGIKREISRLSQQLIVVDGICTNRNKSMRAVLNLQSRGISEDRICTYTTFWKKMAIKFPLVGNACVISYESYIFHILLKLMRKDE